MQKSVGWIFGGVALVAALGIAAVNSVMANCGHCDHDKAKASVSCPCGVKGAEMKVTNIDNGVTITITAKDKDAVKQIQEAAANHAKGELKGCPAEGKAGKAKGHDASKKGTHECEMKDCYRGGQGRQVPSLRHELKESKPEASRAARRAAGSFRRVGSGLNRLWPVGLDLWLHELGSAPFSHGHEPRPPPREHQSAVLGACLRRCRGDQGGVVPPPGRSAG